MASLLIAAPQENELKALLDGFRRRGHAARRVRIGSLDAFELSLLDAVLAVGGHGKVQFGVQTQHLIDRVPDARLVLCVGAAGALDDTLRLGDVVVGTTTVEHDYKLRFVVAPSPCHVPDPTLLGAFRRIASAQPFPFRVQFGAIASGDEDVVDPERAQELRAATGALCVAWEGSGGARAACFSGLGFLEVRVVTDGSDASAASSFHENVVRVMPNLAELLLRWRKSGS